MAQYRTGTVSIDNGSISVSGSGTLWASAPGIAAGQLFNIQGTEGWYYIASINSNTRLNLTAAYSGASVSSESYVIVRDYLTPQNIPLIHTGDTNWPSVYNEAMLRIQSYMGGTGGGTSGIGLDAAYDIGNEITVDQDAVILVRSGTYGGIAPALRIVDQNISGVSGWSPLSGALNYTYSKHRIPIVGVTNYAERGDSGSTSPYVSTAILGVANADEADEFVNYPWLRNVGVAGYSIDYHGNYGVSQQSNIGVYGYSQRGYGIAAKSENTFAIYVEQDGQPGIKVVAPNAIGNDINAERPLVLSNSGYAGADTQFGINLDARKGGVRITSTSTQTRQYPGLHISNAGIVALLQGTTYAESTQTSLVVSGGSIGFPAALIRSNRMALSVSGAASVALEASSTTHPAIKSKDGIIALTDDHTAISNVEKGTIVWSNAASGLMTYDGISWDAVAYSLGGGGGSISHSLHDAYLDGRSISITTGGIYPIAILSTEEHALSVYNSSIALPKTAAKFNSARGDAIEIESAATNILYGAIKANIVGAGTVLNARTTTGRLIRYQTGGVPAGYAIDMFTGEGGGIKIMQTGESVPTYGPIYAESTIATIIKAATNTGKLIDFSAVAGTTQGDGYAVTLNCANGAGVKVVGTGSTGNMLRLENNNSLATMIYVSSGLGKAMEVFGSESGISVSSNGGYAIEADRIDGPSIKSRFGIVASAISPYAVPNPESGTIVYSSSDAICYYYTDAINGWYPFAIPSGYVPPTGAPGCVCIDGVIVYTYNKELIPIEARQEGQLVFDHTTQLVYVVDENLDWILVGGGGGGGGTGGAYSRGYNSIYTTYASVLSDVASFIVPYSGILTGIKFAVDNAPGVGGLTFDVRKKEVEGTVGTTVLGGVPITIAAGAYESSLRTLSETVSQYDSIVFDILTIGGGGSPGGNDIRALYYIDSDFSGAKGVTMLVTGTIIPGASVPNAASFIVPYDGIITSIKAAVDVAPDGGDLVMDINKKLAGGTTWNTILTSLVTVVDGSYESSVVTVNASVSQYDHINLDIDSSGSIVAGGDDLRLLVTMVESDDSSFIIVNVSSNYTVSVTDRLIVIDSSGGPVIITMPAPAGVTGLQFVLKKNGADTNTITINGTDIDGAASTTLVGPWATLTLVSNGVRYNRI